MKKAFTLIELLVVISIISLLASTILAGTAQARVKGRNAAAVRQVGQYRNAAALYYANMGGYPNASDGGIEDKWYCLGAKPADALFCAPGIGSTVDPDIDNAFKTVIPSLPAVSKKVFSTDDGNIGGAGYSCVQYDSSGKCVAAKLAWIMEGEPTGSHKDCLIGNAINSTEVTYNNQSLQNLAMALPPPPPPLPQGDAGPHFICQLSL